MLTSLGRRREADKIAAERILSRTIMRAESAGLFNSGRKNDALPPKLAPDLAIAERRKMHEAMTYFEAAFCAHETVLHLTWCPSEFYFKPGELDAAVILRFARAASRRARYLPAHRRRLIGAVDVSFNVELGLWCVHLHALVVVRGESETRVKRAVKAAFQPGKNTPIELGTLKLRKSKVIRTEQHLLQVFAYVSGCAVLVDHNDEQRRDRRMRSRPEGSTLSSKTNLPRELQAELTKVYAELGPSRFWVLSGFRRHGQRLTPEPPLHVDEEKALMAHTQPRPKPKPFTLGSLAKPTRLF